MKVEKNFPSKKQSRQLWQRQAMCSPSYTPLLLGTQNCDVSQPSPVPGQKPMGEFWLVGSGENGVAMPSPVVLTLLSREACSVSIPMTAVKTSGMAETLKEATAWRKTAKHQK
jgi:hypothetical protein